MRWQELERPDMFHQKFRRWYAVVLKFLYVQYNGMYDQGTQYTYVQITIWKERHKVKMNKTVSEISLAVFSLRMKIKTNSVAVSDWVGIITTETRNYDYCPSSG